MLLILEKLADVANRFPPTYKLPATPAPPFVICNAPDAALVNELSAELVSVNVPPMLPVVTFKVVVVVVAALIVAMLPVVILPVVTFNIAAFVVYESTVLIFPVVALSVVNAPIVAMFAPIGKLSAKPPVTQALAELNPVVAINVPMLPFVALRFVAPTVPDLSVVILPFVLFRYVYVARLPVSVVIEPCNVYRLAVLLDNPSKRPMNQGETALP